MILADNNKDAKARFQIPYESVSRARDPSTARGELAQDFFICTPTHTKRCMEPWLGLIDIVDGY